MLNINKQKMQYSLQGKRIEVYEKDEDGNIKYYESDSGEKIPLVKKEVVGFSNPTIFLNDPAKMVYHSTKAPDDDAYYNPKDGVITIGSPFTNTGKWRIFKNGDEVL